MSEKITIVGAGLVGSLLSIFLAKRGYTVEVLEQRSDPRVKNADRGRSINLAISARGLKALESVGLKEAALKIAIRMPGRMIHLKDSSTHFYPYGINEDEAINSISRSGLNELLLNEAHKTGKVSISFDTRVTEYDATASELTLSSLIDGKTRKITAAPVIATDGSASAMRTGVANASNAGVIESPLNYGYKELVIPASSDRNSPFKIDSNALHIWPRETHMLIALPNMDGSFTVTLFLPYQGNASFEVLKSADNVMEFFKNEFPDIVSLMPNLVEDFFANPTGHMVTVKASKWNHEGNCLLLGDAAHAIVPFFGQGMNAGFEDVSVLNEILEKEGANWKKVFSEVFDQRKTNTDAIADMAEENFIEMRDKVADSRFQGERQIEKKLEKEFPNDYISRYRMVSFTTIPYSIARAAGKVENKLLADLYEKYKTPEAVNLADAKLLIDQELAPILAPYF